MHDPFLIKKLISALLLPLPIVVILLGLGIVLLWLNRGIVWSKLLITLGFVLLLLTSLPWIPNSLLSSLEDRYSPLYSPPHDIRWIVVLGAGQVANPDLLPNDQLNLETLSRVVEGIRLHRLIPQSHLLFSGGEFFLRQPEATTMQTVAISLGVEPHDIAIDTKGKDTREQAKNIKAMIGDDSFILVTSAAHMPRAMRYFEELGIHPIPAPCEYSARTALPPVPIYDYFPHPKYIFRSNDAVHEYLGEGWRRLKSN